MEGKHIFQGEIWIVFSDAEVLKHIGSSTLAYGFTAVQYSLVYTYSLKHY